MSDSYGSPSQRRDEADPAPDRTETLNPPGPWLGDVNPATPSRRPVMEVIMAAVWRQETRHARRGTLWMLLTGALILLAITGRNPKHYQVADAIETAALLGSATVLLVPWIRHWVAVLRARDLETTRDTRSLLLKRLTRNVDLAELAQKVDSNQRRIDAFEQAWSILAPDEPEDVRPPKPRFHVLQGGENADSRDAG